jgi:ABC-type transport system involved in cytochrome c biogenesis ATPase subunit
MTALDAASRQRLLAACKAHLGQGGMIVAATHEPFIDGARVLTLGVRA